MYRARVEAVSGLQVRAGGKWLTCIGNRPVKVGDLIWTDGRCVYGNDRESSMPIITTTKEDWGIPILENADLENDRSAFIFRNDHLKYCGNFTNLKGMLINDDTHAYLATYPTGDNEYRLAINYDKGNLYEITHVQPTGYTAAHSWYTKTTEIDTEYTIRVKKNGNVIFDLPVKPLIEEEVLRAGSGDHDCFFVDSRSGFANGNFAFIEDENRWAFTIWIDSMAHMTTPNHIEGIIIYNDPDAMGIPPPYDPYDQRWADVWMSVPFSYLDYKVTNSGRIYYYDATSKKKQLAQWKNTRIRVYPGEFLTQSESMEYDGIRDVRFPIQDGYYFKATFIQNSIDFIKCDFYSPIGTLLFDGYFQRFPYVTIHKLAKDRYLLGIEGGDLTSLEGLSEPLITGGVYICDKGTWTKIDSLPVKSCRNQRLRPMKRYRNWWKRIQPLDTGGD